MNHKDKNSLGRGKRSRRAKVVYSYTPMNEDELELEVDDFIDILQEVEEGWWLGTLKGKKGVFPSNFVVEQSAEVTKPTSNSSRNSCDSEELVASSDDVDAIKSKSSKAMGFGNIFQDGAIKLKSTNELSPDYKGMTVISPNESLANGAVTEAPKLPPKPAWEQARVIFSYEAQNEDELTLNEGQIVAVLSKDVEDKGWWKGEVNGRIGVFPDNFIELIPATEPSPTKPIRPDIPLPALPQKNRKSPEPKNIDIKPKEFYHKDEETKSNGVKKPLLPSPMTKPQRSPKPVAGSYPSTKSPTPQKPQASQRVEVTNDRELLTDDMKAKSQDKSADVNCVQTTEGKLKHLTANRVKVPNKRPPSQSFIKENNSNEPIVETIQTQSNQPLWMKELKKTQKAKRSSQLFQELDPSCQKDSVEVEKPQKPSPPSKPAPSKLPPPQSASASLDEIKKKSSTFENGISHQKSPTPPRDQSNPDTTKVAKPNEEIPSPVLLLINQMKNEISEIKANSVSKTEFLELKEQYSMLKEVHEAHKTKFNKRLVELMTELDEEKKIRMSMKVEVDRIKKLTMS